MSLSVATSAYHARFIFGDSQRGTGSNTTPAASAGVAEAQTTVSAAPASSSLSGTLDRTGLSKGGVVADTSASGERDAGADQKTSKIQDALTTLLGALGPAADAGSGGNGVHDAIQTILGALAPMSGIASTLAGSSAAQGAASTATTTTATGTAEVVRPNLDALNRVLSHYTAQSAATSTVLSLVG